LPQQPGEKFTVQHVTSWHEWAPTLFSFRVSRDPEYRFVPGRFARMGQRKDDGGTVWRAFSVCSAPQADYLEFFAVVVPHGEFTSLLDRRRVGAEILLEKPAQGFLTADRLWRGEGPKDLWMLATGTGLGPFLSMLRSGQAFERAERVLLVHGTRDWQVQMDQSQEMANALEAHDKDVNLVLIKNGTHDLERKSDRLRLLKELETFLKDNLGPGSES